MDGFTYFAKGGGGGGRGGGGARAGSSSTKSSGSTSSKPSSSSTSTAPAKPPAGKSTATPGSKVTVNGKEVQTSAKKPTNAKYTQSRGVIGDNGYTPRFQGGYSAPAGSVVYYPQHSFFDYLPWIYLFSQDSPQHDHATVVQPDGKEVTVAPEPEGIDGLAVLNWVILIAIALAVIGGIMYAVYKWSLRKEG